MQKDYLEFQRNCEKLESGRQVGKTLLKRVRDLVSQAHVSGVLPPRSLLIPLISQVLPVVGDASAGRKMARLVYVLADLIVEDARMNPLQCDLTDFTVARTLLETHELFRGSNTRRTAALRLYANILQLERRVSNQSVMEQQQQQGAVNTLLNETRQWFAPMDQHHQEQQDHHRQQQQESAGGAATGSSPARSFRRASLKFLNRRRSSTKRDESASLVDGEEDHSLHMAALEVLRAKGLEKTNEDLNLILNGLVFLDSPDLARQASSLMLFFCQKYPVEAAVRLYPLIPHCRQPSARKLNLQHNLAKMNWIKICLTLTMCETCPENSRREFYISMALFLRDRDLNVVMACIAALGKCPWRYCSDFELPAYPSGLEKANILEELMQRLRELYDSTSKTSSLPCRQTRLYSSYKSVQSLGRERAKHIGKYGITTTTNNSMMKVNPLADLWIHLIEVSSNDNDDVSNKVSNSEVRLEAIKALIWITGDQRSTPNHQLKAACLRLRSDHLEEVLEEIKDRVRYDRGLAQLLLELAFSRFCSDPESLGLESILKIFQDCIQSDDHEVRRLVLQDLISLLDIPSLDFWKPSIFAFIGDNLEYFLSLPEETSVIPDDKQQGYDGSEDLDLRIGLGPVPIPYLGLRSFSLRSLTYRLVNAVYFSQSDTSRVCVKVLVKMAKMVKDDAVRQEIRMILAQHVS